MDIALKAVKVRDICIHVVCQAFRFSESCYCYERKLDAENEEVAMWLIVYMQGQYQLHQLHVFQMI
jgi:hypothetical protein